ncbi:MAG: phosphomethylpyrimidine synthase ThiC [Promethearchaeota archaeon]
MTILEEALKGIITDEMRQISKIEHIDEQLILKEIAAGRAIIMKRENCNPLCIGNLFKTKINVNIGASPSQIDIEEELKKLNVAQNFGADTISDLSMGGNIDNIRKLIIANSKIPITTVPIYQAVVEANTFASFPEDIIFKTIEKQINDGVSSIVIHAGFLLNDLKKIKGKRIMGIVSKGGSMTALIMKENNIENPFYSNFDYILELLHEKDIVLNLGNAMRSGCIHDKIDEFNISELHINKKLAKKANSKGIQVIIECLGGHVDAREIIQKIQEFKKLVDYRPLFVSGPLPTEIGVGYDHISGAIGGTFASGFGADYLCTITPAEHLRLPTADDIKEGLIAYKIAAHIGDSLKFGLNHLFNNDLELAKNRAIRNWENQLKYCLDPEEFLKKHPKNQKGCSMCGKYCALHINRKLN